MCGITGFVGRGSPDLIERMTSVIEHRGPDDRGTAFFEGPPAVGLGNTRLAIQDLTTSGHQPMSTTDGRFTIVFNGEIYNFKRLREELMRSGQRFSSHTDTEVVLALFAREGAAMLDRLNGMFALAIWDRDDASLFLARDRFGEKPLYLYPHERGLLFGSEVKSFLQSDDFVPEMDHESLLRYLTFLWVPEPDSMFRGVQKLPAGHLARYCGGRLTIDRYWDLDLHRDVSGSPAELIEETKRQVVRSVQLRLVSDRPVGAFLSGGVDSSTLVAAMAATSPGPIQTYTIGFPPEDFVQEPKWWDEVARAKAVADRLGAQWEHIRLDARIADLLPFVIWHLDEPVADPAVITAYILCKTAKPTRTVLLSGMGGDEVFAGYRRHLAFKLTGLYNRLPRLVRQRALPGLVRALASVRAAPIARVVRDARHFVRNAGLPFEDRFIGYARYYPRGELEGLLSSDMRELASQVDVERTHAEHFARSEGADPLSRMLYVDMKTFMVSLNMLYMDKMAMATAVEGRLPFLDHELVQFAAGIPSNLKIRGMTTKWILRKAFEHDLPRDVLWSRRKVGFGAPIRTWLTRDLKELSHDLLTPERIRSRGLFDPDAVQRILHDPLHDRNNFRIWALMTLELWMQTFLDGARGRTTPLASSLVAAAR